MVTWPRLQKTATYFERRTLWQYGGVDFLGDVHDGVIALACWYALIDFGHMSWLLSMILPIIDEPGGVSATPQTMRWN